MRPSRPKELLEAARVPALLITDRTNVRYVTGYDCSFGVVFVAERSLTLFTDERYREAALRAVHEGIAVRPFDRLGAALRKVRLCGFESNVVTIAERAKWKRKYPNIKFIQTEGVVASFRREKGADELRAFRRAQGITRELLQRIPAALRRRPTEKELALLLLVQAHALGSDGLAFEPIVAFGTHTSEPHHRPTDRRLCVGQIVQIDVGARVRGYCADQSRVFFTGAPTLRQRAVYDAVLASKEAATAAVRPGVSVRELDRIARAVLRRRGFDRSFTHALGHGVGLDIHEEPSLSRRSDAVLRAGEIITIEPGVYLPGRFGIRLEDEVIVR